MPSKGNDESAREEPGFGDESLSSGKIVEDQLADLGAFGGNPADKGDDKVSEIFEAAESEEVSEEEEAEEIEDEKAGSKEEEDVEESDESQEVTSDEEDEPEEEPSEDDDPSDEEDSDEELSEVEQLREQNARLMELLESNEGLQVEEPKPEPEPTQSTAVQPVPQMGLPQVTQDQLDSIMSEEKSFNQYMQGVFNAGQNSMSQQLPRIVGSMIETNAIMTGYFSANADLVPLTKQVQKAAISIQASNPTMTTAAALAQAGEKIRKAIGISRKENKGDKKGKKPRRRFASSTSSRRGSNNAKPKKAKKKDDPKSVENQIEELFEIGNKV